MTHKTLFVPAMALALALPASGQKLHVNPRWSECSIQLDASLTQAAFHQFTEEAGLVTFFRPMTDARPLGKGKFEASILQWKTNIDSKTAAWNDTFVHPDSTHWLFEGNGLKFPGATARIGVTNSTDLGVYFTKSPGGNYGFYGAQLQRALIGDPSSKWAASARASYVALYGPEDVSFHTYGAEVIGSRTIALNRWATLSPYASVSGYLSQSHETSTVVDLQDENTPGGRATLGAALQLSKARLGAEFAVARVQSFSLKLGVGF